MEFEDSLFYLYRLPSSEIILIGKTRLGSGESSENAIDI